MPVDTLTVWPTADFRAKLIDTVSCGANFNRPLTQPLAFRHDGRMLVVACRYEVHLFKTDRWSHLRLRLFEHDGKVDSIAIADDGSIDGSPGALALARFSDEKGPLTIAELQKARDQSVAAGTLQAMLAQ